MAATPSTMLPLGTPAPDFALPGTDGQLVTRDDFAGSSGLLVMFICNHCPYVIHVAAELARIGTEYMRRGVGIVAINSNDAKAYPADSPERMRDEKRLRGYPFPYLYDESQNVARAYKAACTPDLFLFDGDGKLVYRGQLDDSRPGNGRPVTGADLRAALDALMAGQPIPEKQVPSIGCNIKWRQPTG